MPKGKAKRQLREIYLNHTDMICTIRGLKMNIEALRGSSSDTAKKGEDPLTVDPCSTTKC